MDNEEGNDLYIVGPNAHQMDDEIATLARLLKQLSGYSPVKLGQIGCVVAIKQAGEKGLTKSEMEIIAGGVACALAEVTALSLAFENVVDLAVVNGELVYRANANSRSTLKDLKQRLAENN